MNEMKERIPPETDEQKSARWKKSKKSAKSFARSCGIDIKKAMAERKNNERLKLQSRLNSRSDY